MKRQRNAVALALALPLVALIIGACASGDNGGSGAEAKGGHRRLGLLLDVPRNDKSFGTATFTGARRAAKKFGLELSVADNLADKGQEAQSALENLARDSDYVLDGATSTHGYLPRLAQRFPDTQFRVWSAPVQGPSNLAYTVQDWYPLGYLAGVVAARTTKTRTVGFVGGLEVPATLATRNGYEAGVKATDARVKVLASITGSFTDATKGKSATDAQIASGADVVYSFLDAAHEGSVQAATRGQAQLIGIILAKCSISKGREIGDLLARQDELVYNLVEQMVQGKSENIMLGLQDPDVARFEFCPGKENESIQSAIDDATKAFNSGRLKSPDANG